MMATAQQAPGARSGGRPAAPTRRTLQCSIPRCCSSSLASCRTHQCSIPRSSSALGNHRLLVRAALTDDGAAAAAATASPIPTRLNTIPHERETRRHFYQEATASIMKAIDAGETRVLARWDSPLLICSTSCSSCPSCSSAPHLRASTAATFPHCYKTLH